ncbi:mRNA (2'-O-methyladenosine-N(6)-)-methyltransferase-like [Biomphalaria glabrata]|uniref:mRNA (2'-O-methyladenosine-N(6)-)-methyltransferase-like n=1 Tax=Biomphalaria glabrata TaxID=6526 RepID=A0A2C9JII5_BIOGL|nr:mRNA (2'-O-methyladenosine-N(6)-)-methyltransferase-like [Biomphalaria glabrata]
MSGQHVIERSATGPVTCNSVGSKNQAELHVQTLVTASTNSKTRNHADSQSSDGSEPCSPQPMSPDQVHDLPPELLQAGWRKFWSRREGRPYYFNKITNESLWETPMLGIAHDPITDPLGINTEPSNGSVPIPGALDKRLSRPSTEINPLVAITKRRASSELCVGSPLKKAQLNYKPFWNFDIHTNAVIKERAPLHLPPPHPEIESFRSTLVTKIRKNLQDMCSQRENIDAPLDSFNRWLLERKVIDKGKDPLLPSDCTPELSRALVDEIMNDIPLKLIRTTLIVDARRQLFKYAEAAKKMIASSNTSSTEGRKVVKWNVDEVFKWLRKKNNCALEDYLERLTHLKRQCQPHLYEAAEESVKSIVNKIYKMSSESVQKIQAKTWELYKEQNIAEGQPLPQPTNPRLTYCYSVQLSIPSMRLPVVERQIENEIANLKYKGETLKMNQEHFWKMEQLYGLNCRDDPRFDNFLARVWCLLKRYQAYFGINPNEGKGNQGALTPAVMECLHRVFGVTFECFASPFNCYFKQYCSAFPDTDGFFGSRGPFLDFYPTSGSFEANPPFSEELMVAMVDHIENLLEETNEPLSFIIFIPDWRDPPSEALLRLESSKFKRKQFACPAKEHEYRHGFQHMPLAKDKMNVKAAFSTLVVFLQNDAGYNKWTPTTEKIKELVLASKIKDPLSSSSLPS